MTFGPNPAIFYRRLALGGRIASFSYPVTEPLARRSGGNLSALDASDPLVYNEQGRIARHCWAGQRNRHKLQPTALVAAEPDGNAIRAALDEARDPVTKKGSFDLVALNDAMVGLEALDSRQCKIVELRFFGEFSIEETTETIYISAATAKREWATACWHHRAICSDLAL